jgi:hypothetical protein
MDAGPERRLKTVRYADRVHKITLILGDNDGTFNRSLCQ